ncbi:hypothetical protein J3R82DRAFT_3841 [Butyriboletus roseoflavus]|nr:hypothetical protein J3R82DRAFT_3841 [Butyriboletus roseoflavus]
MVSKCAIPIFNGLLPHPHGSIVQELLFELTMWHAYMKLCLHTTDTIDFIDVTTKSLSQVVHRFLNTTYSTKLILYLNSSEKWLHVANKLQYSQARAVLLFPRNQPNASARS